MFPILAGAQALVSPEKRIEHIHLNGFNVTDVFAASHLKSMYFDIYNRAKNTLQDQEAKINPAKLKSAKGVPYSNKPGFAS